VFYLFSKSPILSPILLNKHPHLQKARPNTGLTQPYSEFNLRRPNDDNLFTARLLTKRIIENAIRGAATSSVSRNAINLCQKIHFCAEALKSATGDRMSFGEEVAQRPQEVAQKLVRS
jgi:hypothetical protein